MSDPLVKIVERDPIKLQVSPQTTVVIKVGALRGPAGPTGPSSPNTTASAVAGQTMGGQKVVYSNVDGKAYLVNNTTVSQAGKILGFTDTAVVADATFDVVNGGTVLLSGLVPGDRYYAGLTGGVTNTRPTVGFVQQVGIAMTTTVLAIQICMPIVL